MDDIEELKALDTEKVTINMSAVDLGKVDLLVQEAVYSNRTDFIRTAIRNLLDKHDVELQHAISRSSYVIGAIIYDRADFEALKAKGERLRLTIIGLLRLNRDIDPELASQVIESIKVKGIFDADPKLKQALAGRIS